ncbi:MAG: hypothetical protein LUD68_04825, partial [Rikenellaceae bacterium]|nr:hypothetical protein [Rikenellaceae bacterium]
MKKISVKYFALFGLAALLTACSDFFDADSDSILKEDQYISEESEMYAGFLGIITKLQAVADKAIYIIEPRAEFVEVTTNAPSELYALYNYDENLAGNSYADPAPYYDMVIACNDYLLKMTEYKNNVPEKSINMTHYEALISS